jgi:hypothetical protein
MSYLEKRLTLSTLIEPVKDGSDASFSGKLSPGMKHFQDNIPKYRHSFEHWKNYNNIALNSTLEKIWMRCKNNCTVESRKLAGSSANINDALTLKCIDRCNNEYTYTYKVHVKVL